MHRANDTGRNRGGSTVRALGFAISSCWLLAGVAVGEPLLGIGVHHGFMQVPGIPAQDVLFEVRAGEDDTDELSITIVTENRRYGVTDLDVREDRISFDFVPGLEVECQLAKQPEGDFEGDCEGDSDAEGRIRLTFEADSHPIEVPEDGAVEDAEE